MFGNSTVAQAALGSRQHGNFQIVGLEIVESVSTVSHVMRWTMSWFVFDGEANSVCKDGTQRISQPKQSLSVVQLASTTLIIDRTASDRKHIDSLA